MDYKVKHITNGTRQTVTVISELIDMLSSKTLDELAGAHEISITIIRIPDDVQKI